MLVNSQNNWYTDTMRVCRNKDTLVGNLTRTERPEVMSGISCRVYENNKSNLRTSDTGSTFAPVLKLACAIDVDIHEGDEIWVTRGGRLGYKNPEQRYYAGNPAKYYEPFGGVRLKLEHQEVPLNGEERARIR